MDNQEPVFATTDQMSDPQIRDVYPHKVSKIIFLVLKSISYVWVFGEWKLFDKFGALFQNKLCRM